MENRSNFLRRQLKNKENIYPGVIGGILNKYNKEHPNMAKIMGIETENGKDKIDLYLDWLEQFNISTYYDKNIQDITSREDFIVDNETLYIIFVAGISADRLNILKVHLIENFVVNWDVPEKFFPTLNNDEFLIGNNLSISSITGNEIFSRSFNKELMSTEDMFTDIQFILLNGNSKEYYKGEFDRSIKSHISSRNGLGLITIIFYLGSDTDYKNNNYEEFFYPQRKLVIIKDLKLNKEEKGFAKVHKSTTKEENTSITKEESTPITKEEKDETPIDKSTAFQNDPILKEGDK